MSNWTKLPDCQDILPQNGRVIIVHEKPVAIFNIDGKYAAMDNRCPHRGGSLGDGALEGKVVTCPWHGWQFNCRTGEAVENEAVVVRTYPLENRQKGLYIKID
ncbi:MAG: Rieske 2Fe-2S domain-containing protein [Candidatus Neomarinimicrobiota bacterium]|nr:Rieske 2Fe-2S domain-containing protein [Candidatus Neomarinimicrobiota bacterium]